MHALASILAMQRGKHVYCQKPLAHTVWECRQMALWAKKKNLVTQMGNQVHSQLEYRLATRLLREGVIGGVKEVHSWITITGNERTRLLEPPAPGKVPPEVDWNLWVGGAPMRPYAPEVYHPFAWRDWQDFGNGALGDFGCHILDPVFTALNITGAPLEFMADHTGMNDEVWPAQTTVEYLFPGTPLTASDKLRITWYDGGLLPSVHGSHIKPTVALPRSGSIFIGETGTLVQPHVAVVYLRAQPETLDERVRRDDQPRPLLAAAPLEQLRAMHEARDHRYEALALRVEAIDDRSPEQIAGSLLDALAADLAVPGLPRGVDG